MKAEPLSPDEQKKLRRRNQIACSVQRHREKKKVRFLVDVNRWMSGHAANSAAGCDHVDARVDAQA